MTESIKYRGYTIEIDQDHDPLNPRTDYDNMSTMCCYHSNYNLGDEHEQHPEAHSIQEEIALRFAEDDEDLIDAIRYADDEEVKRHLERAIKHASQNAVIMPLYLFDHSGLSMSVNDFGCRWDSGTVGFAYITRERMLKEFGGKYFTKKLRERAAEIIRAEVELYDEYLTGNVYHYNIEEFNDGCGSFFGYDHEKSGLLAYARDAIDCHIEHERKRKQGALKTLIRNRVPLQNRAQILTNMNL